MVHKSGFCMTCFFFFYVISKFLTLRIPKSCSSMFSILFLRVMLFVLSELLNFDHCNPLNWHLTLLVSNFCLCCV